MMSLKDPSRSASGNKEWANRATASHENQQDSPSSSQWSGVSFLCGEALWPLVYAILKGGSSSHLILVAKSTSLSQAACSMTRLKAEVRVCSGASPRSQLIS